MAVSSAAEVEFLRDQVQRLEATLAHYQQRYKPIKVADERLPTSDAPWAKHEVLSPLLLEYDDSINECMESNERLRSEFSTMKREMGRVVKENDTLRREVKDEMQKVLEAERSDSEGNEADVKELKLQLQAALKEKERASELCQSAVTDVEKLELEMEKMRANPQWRQTSEVKNQYQRAVDEMSKEVSQLQDELRRTYAEKRTAEVQVGDLRQTLEELRQQLMLQQKAHHDAVGEGVLYQEENELVKRQVNDKESKLSIVETDLEKFKRESKALNETCKELQAKCVDLEQKEYEASLQVRDSVQLVENAVLERDQVRIHEQQLLDENRKLQDAFNKLLDEAGSRTREEVENVKQLFNTNLERLTEELYHVEMESAEKTSQMERLVRDKKQLESELEKCYKDGLTQGTNDQNNLTELTKRACVAEAERDDAVIKHDNLQNQMKRFEMGRAQEKHQFVTKCKQLKERLEKSDTELETINKERLQTQDELDNVRRQLINLQKEKDSAERKFSRELACLEQEHKMKERESEVRLQTLEDSQRQSLVEVRRHLNAQQKAASKWKVECESITHQFEKKVAELRAEGNRMKLKNLELIHLLAESQKKTAEAKQMVTEYTRSVKRMEDKVREAEQKARLENAKIVVSTSILVTLEQASASSSSLANHFTHLNLEEENQSEMPMRRRRASPSTEEKSSAKRARHGSRKTATALEPPADTTFSNKRCRAWFHEYTGPDDDAIQPEGMEKFCEDIAVEPENIVMLSLAYKLDAKQMGFFTLAEWLKGMSELHVDNTNKLRQKLDYLRSLLDDQATFKNIYRFAFDFARDKDQRAMDMELAKAMLQLLLGRHWSLYSSFSQFLDQSKYKVINKDQWCNVLEFSRTIKPDLSNYDEDGAWPVMLDEFVDWLREKRQETDMS